MLTPVCIVSCRRENVNSKAQKLLLRVFIVSDWSEFMTSVLPNRVQCLKFCVYGIFTVMLWTYTKIIFNHATHRIFRTVSSDAGAQRVPFFNIGQNLLIKQQGEGKNPLLFHACARKPPESPFACFCPVLRKSFVALSAVVFTASDMPDYLRAFYGVTNGTFRLLFMVPYPPQAVYIRKLSPLHSTMSLSSRMRS